MSRWRRRRRRRCAAARARLPNAESIHKSNLAERFSSVSHSALPGVVYSSNAKSAFQCGVNMLRLSSKCSIAAVLLVMQLALAMTADTTVAPNTIGSEYCAPELCEIFNGTHVQQVPHIGCANNGSFSSSCGPQPHLLYMSERRRNLLLDMHNLARAKTAAGQLEGYKPAAHMPLLRWDMELEHLATLHAKRCQFAHDQCRNTLRFKYSGQNIGYYWIERKFKSHSRRMRSFVVNWFREYADANQTYIDSYHPHPERKKIGHFTLLVADRVHRVGCAAVRFRDPNLKSNPNKNYFLLTCNYDYNNVNAEPIYQSGPMASKCAYRVSEKYPSLCDWKDPVYDYDSEESVEDNNTLDNNIKI